jgi:uncharacterized Zn-finger protein
MIYPVRSISVCCILLKVEQSLSNRKLLRVATGSGSIPAINRNNGQAIMAGHGVPHFCNDVGVEKIHIGVREFNCMGAKPPHDHPHIYLDMGSDNQIVCPYCSTLYLHDPNLASDQSDPPYCLHQQNGRKAV